MEQRTTAELRCSEGWHYKRERGQERGQEGMDLQSSLPGRTPERNRSPLEQLSGTSYQKRSEQHGTELPS